MTNDLIDKLKENAIERIDGPRAVAETLGQMSIAKKYPRDMGKVEEKLRRICANKAFAESSYYHVKRGKEMILGPSIRLAEAIASCMGNLTYGISSSPGEDENSSRYTVYALDLETNVRIERSYTRIHLRKVKQNYYRVEDPSQQYELIAADAAKRLRACIFNIVPKYLVDLGEELCKETLRKGPEVNKEEIVGKIIMAFREYDVSQQDIETKIGKQLSELDGNDITILRGTLNTLKQNIMTRDELFPGVS